MPAGDVNFPIDVARFPEHDLGKKAPMNVTLSGEKKSQIFPYSPCSKVGMRYSQTSHTGYDPTTRTTIFQSRRYSATSWEVLVVLETKATFYWDHNGKIFQKSSINKKQIFYGFFLATFKTLLRGLLVNISQCSPGGPKPAPLKARTSMR